MTRGSGPGPGAYMLPPTVGYKSHDPTKYRNPEYSIARRFQFSTKGTSPGPNYDVSAQTRYGKATPPAFSLAARNKEMSHFTTPGPGNYNVEFERKGGFTMAARFQDKISSGTPGPNQYTLPSAVGPKIPDKAASAAYSIVGNHGITSKHVSPGPAQYPGIILDSYKNKHPAYSMTSRHEDHHTQSNPGPAAYLPKKCVNPSCCQGGFSFGARTAAIPYITAEDAIPCITREK